jgi:hypothetical protein
MINREPTQMDTNETLLFRDEVYRIVGCAMEVLNEGYLSAESFSEAQL